MIPGVAGSKLVGQNKKTFEEECAWIAASLKYAGKIAQYLWGTTDPSTHTYNSFVADWADVKPLTGLAGCDHIIDASLLDSKPFKGTSLDNYYGKLATYLTETMGYEYLTNLFAFSYDWRQQLAHPIIMDALRILIKDVHSSCKKKITLIGHSLGGIVIETYMKLYPDWGDDIERFIALQTPFDGSSAYANISHIQGYNLQLPLQHCLCKAIEVSSGSQQYMMSCPYGHGPLPQIFIKRKSLLLKDKQLENNDNSQQINILDLKDVQLNEGVYENSVPDVCFAIAKLIKAKPDLIKSINRRKTFELLQSCCKRKAIIIEEQECILPEQKIEQALEPDFKATQLTTEDLLDEDFTWEVYSPWGISKSLRTPQRHFEYVTQKFVKFDNQQLFFSHKFQQLRVNGVLQQEQRESNFPELRDYVQAQIYYDELTTGMDEMEIQSLKCNCNISSQIEAPWGQPTYRSQIIERSIYDLTDQCYHQGSFERLVFTPTQENYELATLTRTVPIDFSKAGGFKFISISGSGRQTPLHAVYQKPINKIDELPYQKPSFVYGDGDGTVLLNSALSDPFPSEFVVDRVVVPGFEHFGAMSQERMFQLVAWALNVE